jgi:UDP-glucose 4-epimerase
VALASTSEIYGKAMQKDTSLERLSETDDWTLGAPSKRRWGYACSKAMDEFLAHAYADEYGLSMIALRFFNTVGPRQSGRYGMVVPNFVSQALAGEDIRVFGDGEQTRCFTHVADAVRAVTDLLDAPGVEGGAYNIGTTEETSINALAERARTLAGSTSEIVHVPYEEAYGPGFEDMRRRTPDLQKLRDTTGYVPQKSLDDILNDVISHMRRSHGATHKDREAASADLNAFSS